MESEVYRSKNGSIINSHLVVGSIRLRVESTSTYLSFCGTVNPSSLHLTLGGGFPLAMHRRDTDGPGCRVCSENLYRSTGDASGRRRNFFF